MARKRSTSLRLMVATGLLSLLPLAGLWFWKREGPLHHDAIFLIKKGSTVSQIADELEAQGIIRSAKVFKLWARARKLVLIRGEYVLRSGASLSEVARKLRKGEFRDHLITISPAMHGWSLQKRLKNFVPEEVFWQLWCSPTLISAAGFPEAESLEGLLAPATYHINRAMEPEEIMLMMVERFRENIRPLLDGGTLKPYQTLVLASLVERETRLQEERARVAGVYLKRLRMGMKLQCDPTSLYARWASGNMDMSPPASNDLRRVHRFNTYCINGLPPTPIAVPSMAAIEAAKKPLLGEDIFFVATGRGGHAFSANLKGHNRNVSNFRKFLKEQKERKAAQEESEE